MHQTKTTNFAPILAAREQYAGRGWKTVPLTEGKTPNGVKGWQAKTFDADDFNGAWARKAPELGDKFAPGVGVQLGPASQIIDAEWDNDDQLSKLVELCGGSLPDGPQFTSKKGGHALFKWDDRLAAIGATVDFPTDLKVRIGGVKGAQSAFPPSPGKAWVEGTEHLPVPAAPESLIVALLANAKATKASSDAVQWSEHRFGDDIVETCRECLEKMPDAISGDNGHDKFFAAACETLRHVGNREQAADLLRWFNDNKTGDEPFDDDELLRKLDGAAEDQPPRLAAEDEFDDVAPQDVAVAGKKGPFAFSFMRWDEFQAADFPQRYLVPNIIVEGESLIIGGRTKSLKTMLTLDLMVSLASGEPFLGYFPVSAPTPVAFLSGESGKATLQRAAKTMAEHRGAKVPNDNFFIDFKLPSLSDKTHLGAIETAIRHYGIKLFCIDPAYLATLSAGNTDKASNQFAMGLILEPYGRIGVETGCTMALVHHAKKTTRADAFKPMSRDDLTQSGFDAWMRQWILVSRRSEYRKGQHDLHMEAGGSACHGGQWRVAVDEGQPSDPLIGRRWAVRVLPIDEAEQAEAAAKSDAAALELSLDFGQVRSVLLANDNHGMSKTAIGEKCHFGKAKRDAVIQAMLDADELEECDYVSSNHGPKPGGFRVKIGGEDE